MPEGDTVHRLARVMDAALRGERILRSDVRVPRFALTDLSGQRVLEVVARGKHLLLRTDGGRTLHSHLKMEGAWHLYRRGERWRGPSFQARVVLETPDRVAVGFRLSGVAVVPTAGEHELVGHLGPDPLGPDWDAEMATRRLVAQPKDRPIADVLLDQRVIAGIGNVYKSEICFMRALSPWTPVGAVPDPRGVVDLAKRLLEANREHAKHVTTGDPRPGRHRYVYGRDRQPCRRCGTAIARRGGSRDDDRVTYWCPGCQPQRRD